MGLEFIFPFVHSVFLILVIHLATAGCQITLSPFPKSPRNLLNANHRICHIIPLFCFKFLTLKNYFCYKGSSNFFLKLLLIKSQTKKTCHTWEVEARDSQVWRNSEIRNRILRLGTGFPSSKGKVISKLEGDYQAVKRISPGESI